MLVMIRYEAHEDQEAVNGFDIVDADSDITWIEVPSHNIRCSYDMEQVTETSEAWGAVETTRRKEVTPISVEIPGGFEVLNVEDIIFQLEDVA